MRYTLYACRWDDPTPIVEVPFSAIEFTAPVSDHGECTFTATVEPGRSFWRPALSAAVSGVMVCRDGVPVWSGRLWSERQSGPRSFDFSAAEWGSCFERTPAGPGVWSNVNDHQIFRDLVTSAQSIEGQDFRVTMGNSMGAASSDLTINAWDDTITEEQFRQLGNAEGGPEWYFHTTGTYEAPVRRLVLSDRLGSVDPVATLEYVEDTARWGKPGAPPVPTTLGNVFPGPQPQAVVGRRGGNLIAAPAREQDATTSATAAIAVGSGDQAAQLRSTAVADDLIAAGYPRQTVTTLYDSVKFGGTLNRHAAADLAAGRGIVTTYTLSTFDGAPDWTSISRGDTVLISLDTDIYGEGRPVEFTARVLSTAVQVQPQGPAAVNYTIATVREL